MNYCYIESTVSLPFVGDTCSHIEILRNHVKSEFLAVKIRVTLDEQAKRAIYLSY